MEIPKVVKQSLIEIPVRVEKQASFALNRVVVNLKRGDVMAHFPAKGVERTEGYLCNNTYPDDSTLDWATVSSPPARALGE